MCRCVCFLFFFFSLFHLSWWRVNRAVSSVRPLSGPQKLSLPVCVVAVYPVCFISKTNENRNVWSRLPRILLFRSLSLLVLSFSRYPVTRNDIFLGVDLISMPRRAALQAAITFRTPPRGGNPSKARIVWEATRHCLQLMGLTQPQASLKKGPIGHFFFHAFSFWCLLAVRD